MAPASAAVFQQDGAPPHFHNEVREELNNRLPKRWVGRDDSQLLCWSPRSPDLTPLDFFMWGYVKDSVYKPPPPQTIHDLNVRIREAIASAQGPSTIMTDPGMGRSCNATTCLGVRGN